MASIQWKDANSAYQIAGPLLSTPASQQRAYRGPSRTSELDEIEQMAQESVRSQRVENDLYWVVLNLPNQTSCTLYLGSNEEDAALIEATARGAVTHALEFAFGASGSPKLECTQ